MNIRDIEERKVDGVMHAIGSVIKAIISVAKCFNDLSKKDELPKKPVV